MKKILFLLLIFPLMLIAQSTNQNYTKTILYKKPTTQGVVDVSQPENAAISVTYFDGLGRPIQQIAHKQSATGQDIITPIVYDQYGRQTKENLSYRKWYGSPDMNYISSASSEIVSYYTTTDSNVTGNTSFENTSNPFSEKLLESSPLNRVLKQSAPGNPWVMGGGKEIKYDYLTNGANEVKRYLVSTTAPPINSQNQPYEISVSLNGFFAPNELYKTVTKDENWTSGVNNTVEEFRDKEGKVILKRAYNNSVAHDTYYLYDRFGNLTYVLPPLSEGTISQTVLDGLCYQYKYDFRNRLIEKKLPGKQWEFIIYDKFDRIVATGPSLSPFTNAPVNTYGWLVNKYDSFSRIIYSGWQSEASTFNSTLRSTRQNGVNTLSTFNESKVTSSSVDGIDIRYTNNIAYFSSPFILLYVNYFDNYDFPNAPTTFSNVENQPVYYNATIKPTGLQTGTWTRVVEASNSTIRFESSYVLYDEKARPIRNYTTNYLGGFTQIDTKYDFLKVLYTLSTHKRTSSGTLVTVKDTYTYTNQDRVLTHTHQIDNGPIQLIAKNEYDELGQLIVKKVGGTDVTGALPLQKVDYSYNVRGWLKGINNINNLSQGTDPRDLFAFKINYDTPDNTLGGAVQPLYNGNISETYWRTDKDDIKRKYGYQYDKLNRLTNAYYQRPDTSTLPTNSYNESLSYDKNGNIISLVRNGDLDDDINVFTIDNLNYYYQSNSNKLTKVTDIANHSSGFKDDSTGYNDTVDDYVYDDNGNMTSDQNKGITLIKYNHLNLPTEITFSGTSTKKINYLYNGKGLKLKKIITNGSSITSIDYLDGYQYRQIGSGTVSLEFFTQAEGYVSNTVVNNNNSYNYVFNFKDHLGNNRLSYTYDAQLQTLSILEENHYYPFGLKHNNYNIDQEYFDASNGNVTIKNKAIPYKYRYNSKEYQDELGLNFYDYGARNYDPAIGRWINVDPLAEVSKRWNTYNYCYNNPITNVDPDGMKAERSQTANIYYDWDEGRYRTQAGETASEEEALSQSNWMPLTANTLNSYAKDKYKVADNQLGDFVGKLFEKAFIKFGEQNFEEDANFNGVSGRSTLSIPDAYSDGYHFNFSRLQSVRYEKSVWWEVKSRNKNVTLDKQIKGFIDSLADEFQYTATKTGAAFLCLVTTSNSNVSPEVYVYAKSKGVAIQHWQAQYKMENGTMTVDFGYKNSPVTPLVFEFSKPVKL